MKAQTACDAEGLKDRKLHPEASGVDFYFCALIHGSTFVTFLNSVSLPF